MKPLLAAIIFTYNHKTHIARCIESHLNQKTTYNYEIRIYDDCSTDGTTDICREYAEKYPDKIKLTVQPENSFLKPYSEMQSYKAIQEIDTKYFCIIDGDDCWCDENKIQTALDCLESHPEYIGFAHDTCHINKFTGKEESYVHSVGKWNNFDNPVVKKAVPFFCTSSRVFRNCGFKDECIIPVDYLIYFYHAAKGPIYYCDKIMANYYISQYNNFSNMEGNEMWQLLTTFGYKVAKFFDYKEDQLAMDVQAYYNKKSCKKIERYKKIFGIKWGWNIWYFINFVPIYGFESFDLNWVCTRKLIKKRADNRDKVLIRRYMALVKDMKIAIRKLRKHKMILNAINLCVRYISCIKDTAYIHRCLQYRNRQIDKYKRNIKNLHKEKYLIEKSKHGE